MYSIVINGDYNNFVFSKSKDNSSPILQGTQKSIELSKDTINKYEVIHIEYGKSIADIISRVIIGVALVGTLGILAGLTASNTYEYYRLVDIEFKDGKKSRVKFFKKHFKQFIEVIYKCTKKSHPFKLIKG